MKQFRTSTLAGVLAVIVTASAGSVQAQQKLDNISVVNVSFKLQIQAGFTDNGTTKTYPKPTNARLNTKDLLDLLARDKFAQTNYPATLFPAGSKLAVNGDTGAFVVVSRNDELLMDVSDIMSFSTGTNVVLSGKVSDETGLASPKTTELVFATLTFDDTFIAGGGNLKFSLQGIDEVKTNDSKPGNGGGYKEKSSDQMKNAMGEGSSGGAPLMITGSISGKRSAKLTLD